MEDCEWNVFDEIHLFEAMVGHKPIGINKHFEMFIIWDKFTTNINKDVSPEKIWSYLKKTYNMDKFDELVSLPFPNNETEFCLPDNEYGVLKAKKEEKEDKKHQPKGRETPKMLKESRKEEIKSSTTKITKDVQRRDSRDSTKDFKSLTPTFTTKKDGKKEVDKSKSHKGRSSLPLQAKEDRNLKKAVETTRSAKRPTRNSLKPEDSNVSGKASPVNVTSGGNKRRRIM